MSKKNENISEEISVNAIMDQPESVFDLINKYGTYEIKPTADTENELPQIAQGPFTKTKIKTKNSKK